MGRQPWTEERAARCFELRREGLSFLQIGRQLGVTRAAVSGYLDRHADDRLKAFPKPPTVRRKPIRPTGSTGSYAYEVPKHRKNDDTLHLTLMLAALREQRAA